MPNFRQLIAGTYENLTGQIIWLAGDQEAKQLYDYLYFEFLAQKRPTY